MVMYSMQIAIMVLVNWKARMKAPPVVALLAPKAGCAAAEPLLNSQAVVQQMRRASLEEQKKSNAPQCMSNTSFLAICVT